MLVLRKWSLDSEPSLDEMLDDPVVQAVMTRDGVDRRALMQLVGEARSRLRESASPPVRKPTPPGGGRREPYLLVPTD